MVSLYGVATVSRRRRQRTYDLVRDHATWSRSRRSRRPRATSRHRALPALTRRSSISCARHPPGRGGEIQLTDAIKELAKIEPVHGVVFNGRRYDTGDRADYVKAVVRLACERPDIGPELWAWLQEYVAAGGPGGARHEVGRSASG